MAFDRVNIDFEPQLFNLKNKSSFNREFEYVYFFFDGANLKNVRDYPKDYLEYLKGLGLKIPKFDPENKNAHNWWGEISDLSRDLNSKITALEIAQQNDLCPKEVILVNNTQDIITILEENPEKYFFIRDPYLAAGNNTLICSQNSFNKKFVEGPLIMAPYYKRLMDLGFIFNYGEIELLWNLNSKDGKFKGGIVFKDETDLFNFIEKKWGFKKEEIFETQKKIFDLYKDRGAGDLIQFDSFFYEEDDRVKYYPLVEANYRKSFGLFINRLKPFLPEGGVGIFLNLTSKDLLPCESFAKRIEQIGDLLYQNKRGVIPLSPQDGMFSSFFVVGPSLIEINEMAQKLWGNISLSTRPISPSLLLEQFLL
jgi:hypothetical protein